MLMALDFWTIGDRRGGVARALVSPDFWTLGTWPSPSSYRPTGERTIEMRPSPLSATKLVPSPVTASVLRPRPISAEEE